MTDSMDQRRIGVGKEAEVFRHGGLVIKLLRAGAPKSSAFREAAVLALLEPSGLPVPRVIEVREMSGRWGLVMTPAPGPPFGESMGPGPDLPTAHLAAMLRLHRRIHAQAGTGLPGFKARLRHGIESAPGLPASERERLLAGLSRMPEGDRLCHGDFHPWNILGTPAEATIIDWLDAACGDPSADVCRSFVLIHSAAPDLARRYVEAYAEGEPARVAAVMDWLPFVAAARLSEGVPDERDRLLRLIEGPASAQG